MKEALQIIRMCIQTHVNLYGRIPTRQELAKQVGNLYIPFISDVLQEYAVA
ncbi:MAG: hypothetical protein IKE58_01535 [Blautia sp.]|nr:hypothetical protein [Blautia sp.]